MALKRAVYSKAVKDLIADKESEKTYFDITNLTTKKLRLIDVDAFLDKELIQVDELEDEKEIPNQAYAAISHIWTGLSPDTPNTGIKIRGLDWKDDKGKMNWQDPINVNVLQQVCTAARKEGCSHIWLDKFCIIQDRKTPAYKEDQPWQLPFMFTIYNDCRVCLVAPGGLCRLPRLEEDTQYLQRLWTLQEALAPKKIQCLFKWDQGDAILQNNAPMFIEALSTGESAMADLTQMLVVCVKGGGYLQQGDSSEEGPYVNVNVLATGPNSDPKRLDAAWVLLGCKDQDDRFSAPDVAATSLWRAMLLRTASYPQDLVFGSMGMFGVNVPHVPGADPTKKYNDKQLALLLVDFVRRTKEKSYRAQWLGCIPAMPPAADMTMLPPLPVPSADGGATWSFVTPSLTNGIGHNWWLSNAVVPQNIGENGDINFKALSCPIKPTDRKRELDSYTPQSEFPGELMRLSDGSVFELTSDGDDTAMAVVAGHLEWYRRGDFPMMQTSDMTLIMLLVAKDGILRNVGYAWGDENIAADWKEREILAGGAPKDLEGVNVTKV